jgi:hypothetical protein
MKHFKDITSRMTWLLMVIEFAGLLASAFVTVEAVLFLKSRFYDDTALTLNIVYYASPIIAMLLARETDSEVFLVGIILLLAYTIFIDLMYLAHLFEHHEDLGILQWLYILPAALVTYMNFYFIRRAKIRRYCPSCRARMKLKEQKFCHDCGIDLYRYGKEETQSSIVQPR